MSTDTWAATGPSTMRVGSGVARTGRPPGTHFYSEAEAAQRHRAAALKHWRTKGKARRAARLKEARNAA